MKKQLDLYKEIDAEKMIGQYLFNELKENKKAFEIVKESFDNNYCCDCESCSDSLKRRARSILEILRLS